MEMIGCRPAMTGERLGELGGSRLPLLRLRSGDGGTRA
jgi:hypothetical protein